MWTILKGFVEFVTRALALEELQEVGFNHEKLIRHGCQCQDSDLVDIRVGIQNLHI